MKRTIRCHFDYFALCTLVSAFVAFISPGALAQSNTVEIGLGYNSENSYRFGQYSGLTQQGGYAVGGFSLTSALSDSDNLAWHVTGKNLGLETAALEASYGRWGSFSLNLNLDQIPHYRFNDGMTPFNGSGSTVQTLPANWAGAGSTAGLSRLSSSLKAVNIDTRRDRVSGGFSWQINEAWSFLSEFRHEIKEGNETLGAIFGSTGGNPRGALLARPVDYQTDEIDLGLSYTHGKTHYNLGYNLMLFSNRDSALWFDNPFNNSQWANGANFSNGAVGQIGLEPDNTSSQLSFSAVHSFAGSSRLSGSLISTRLTQDDRFLPYSNVLSATAGLPAGNLRGRVDSLVANLNFSTRLSRKSTLVLRYDYRDRDNKTPQNLYQRIPGDAANQSALFSGDTRVNRIYDLQREKLSADLNYRLTGKTRLSIGYDYLNTDRTMVDVANSEEHTGFVKLNFSASSIASGWVKLTRSDRDASSYDGTVPFVAGHNPDYVATLVGVDLFENDPLLRRFHLSDRRRDEFSANFNIYPNDRIGVSLLGMLAQDDYPDARVGLKASDKANFAVDLSYTPDTNWVGSIYYNFDRYDNHQVGFSRSGGGNPTPFFPASIRDTGRYWSMKSKDTLNTVGAGVDWELMGGKLDLSIDATYTDAVTETRPYSTGLAWEPYSEVTTEITSLLFKGRYQLAPGRELAIRYWYENFASNDWALDSVNVDSLSNILLLGNDSPVYRGNVFEVSVLLKF